MQNDWEQRASLYYRCFVESEKINKELRDNIYILAHKCRDTNYELHKELLTLVKYQESFLGDINE